MHYFNDEGELHEDLIIPFYWLRYYYYYTHKNVPTVASSSVRPDTQQLNYMIIIHTDINDITIVDEDSWLVRIQVPDIQYSGIYYYYVVRHTSVTL